MSREAELIKEINEHIKKAGGLYGLELPESDLLVIRAALFRTVPIEPANKEDCFGDTALCCPYCGNPVTNYYGRTQPACCQFCGQRLKRHEGGDPPSEK